PALNKLIANIAGTVRGYFQSQFSSRTTTTVLIGETILPQLQAVGGYAKRVGAMFGVRKAVGGLPTVSWAGTSATSRAKALEDFHNIAASANTGLNGGALSCVYSIKEKYSAKSDIIQLAELSRQAAVGYPAQRPDTSNLIIPQAATNSRAYFD